MTHEVKWSAEVLQKFKERALLNDEEYYIMKSRIEGKTVKEQAMYLNLSPRTIARRIDILRAKYDIVYNESPDEFPKRITSKEEEYLDTH